MKLDIRFLRSAGVQGHPGRSASRLTRGMTGKGGGDSGAVGGVGIHMRHTSALVGSITGGVGAHMTRGTGTLVGLRRGNGVASEMSGKSIAGSGAFGHCYILRFGICF